MPNIFTSLIQSDFGSKHGNFEAVIKVGQDLLHFWRDNTDENRPWKQGRPISHGNVAFAGAIIQSSLKSKEHGNFEVVVPLQVPHGYAELWHFFHDNADINNPWIKVRRITGENDQVIGPASIIQSDIKSGEHGNFEVVMPLQMPNGHIE